MVENQGRDGKSHQHVLWTIGRVDRLKEKGTIDRLLRSLAKYSERALLLLAGISDPNAEVDRLKKRFHLTQVCIVSDRGMMSKKTIEELEKPRQDINYILGVRMRKQKEVSQEVLSRAGAYWVVHPLENSPQRSLSFEGQRGTGIKLGFAT